MATNNAINTPEIVLAGTFTMTGGFPFVGNLTGSTNVTFPTSGTLATVAGGGITTVVVSGTSQTMSANTRYIANNASLVTLTLPSTFGVGDLFVVDGLGAGGWQIAQNAGQNIIFGDVATTVGVSGYLASTNKNDTIRFVGTIANTQLIVEGAPQGNITYV